MCPCAPVRPGKKTSESAAGCGRGSGAAAVESAAVSVVVLSCVWVRWWVETVVRFVCVIRVTTRVRCAPLRPVLCFYRLGLGLPVGNCDTKRQTKQTFVTVRGSQGGSSSRSRGRHVGACDASKSGMMITASLRSVSALQSGVLVTSGCQPLVRKAQAPG